MKHHINRTSPKGQNFIGTCLLCGKTGLTPRDAQSDCENVRGLSAEDALIETITGTPNSVRGILDGMTLSFWRFLSE